MRALQVSLCIAGAFVIGCTKTDFPTTPSPVADTPLTTLAALKVDGSASLPAGVQTPFNMTLIARSLNSTAPDVLAQTPGTTDVSGNFALGTGVTGTVSGSISGSLQNGNLRATLRSSADGCTRQYDGPVSTAGLSLIAGDSTGGCPLPISVQGSRADAPSACTYSNSPIGVLPGGVSTTVVDITTGPTCTWVVEPQATWLRVTGPSTGIGPGTVTLVADPSDVPRQGIVLVAGRSVSIDQVPACSFALTPQGIAFPDTGGTRSLTVTTLAHCEWRAENTPSWLTVSPTVGTGSTTVTLAAQPNSGAQREVSLRISGQAVPITQAPRSGGPAPCIESITLSAAAFPAGGGTGAIDVGAAAPCAWTAQADVPWIILSGESGSGAGRIGLNVQPNTGPARTGTVRVGGRVLTITQAAAPVTPPCTYTVSVSPLDFPTSGGSGTVAMTTGEQCEWVVQSVVDWITVETGPAKGNGTAQFIVAANPSGAPRQGELRIGGQSFIVTQQPLLAPVTVTLISVSSNSSDGGGPYGGGTVVASGFACSIGETSGNQSPSSVVCPQSFPVGSSVTFTAQPGPNSAFSQWSGGCSIGLSCAITVTAAGNSLSATFAPCVEAVTPSATQFPAAAGTGTIDVAARGACAWSARTDDLWITISGGSGSGPGRFSFSVQANSGPPRTGTIRVGEQVVTITQADGRQFIGSN